MLKFFFMMFFSMFLGLANAFGITATDVPTATIITDVGVVFTALLGVALAVFGAKRIVGMFR